MIRYVQGNLLEAPCEALVNAVNTVGVMGKGIALAFKQHFPENFRRYAAACKNGDICTGKIFVTDTNALIGPRWIINFPTKQHWKHPSKLEWVKAGLSDLRRFVAVQKIKSLAVPALGAGNGGLPWQDVRSLIEHELDALDTEIWVYEPLADEAQHRPELTVTD